MVAAPSPILTPSLAQLAHPASKAIPGLQALKANKALRDPLGQLALKERQANRVPKANKGRRVFQGSDSTEP